MQLVLDLTQVRNTLVLTIITAFGFWILYLQGSQASQDASIPNPVLKAHELQLVDAKGNIRAVLRIQESGEPVLDFLSCDGSTIVSLGTYLDISKHGLDEDLTDVRSGLVVSHRASGASSAVSVGIWDAVAAVSLLSKVVSPEGSISGGLISQSIVESPAVDVIDFGQGGEGGVFALKFNSGVSLKMESENCSLTLRIIDRMRRACLEIISENDKFLLGLVEGFAKFNGRTARGDWEINVEQ